MAAIAFPASPTDGQEYTHNDVTYKYEAASNKWKVLSDEQSIDGGTY